MTVVDLCPSGAGGQPTTAILNVSNSGEEHEEGTLVPAVITLSNPGANSWTLPSSQVENGEETQE